MHIARMRRILSTLLAVVTVALWIMSAGQAEDIYTSRPVYTIPWGDCPGCLSTTWNIDPDSPDWPGMYDPPGPWAVSSTGELVIFTFSQTERKLIRYGADGTLGAWADFTSYGFPCPWCIAISSSGYVLMSRNFGIWEGNDLMDAGSVYLLDPSLQLLWSWTIPGENVDISGVFPSDSNSFWVQYSTCHRPEDDYWHYDDSSHLVEQYVVQVFVDASVSGPELICSAFKGDPVLDQHFFVTPSGEPRSRIEDRYGYTYRTLGEDPIVGRFSPDGELVSTFDYGSDPGWTGFRAASPWFVTWAGDVYTLHASDEGAVLTKYTLVVQ